jgi:hypothetical protein
MKEHIKIKESLLAIVLVGILLFFITKAAAILYVVFGIGLLGLASSSFAGKVHIAWNKIIGIIGIVNNTILLSVIYWLVLTPVALLMRLFKKSPVILKKPAATNFIERNHVFTKNDLNNPW